MLSENEARGLEGWVEAASAWSKASQGMVAAANDLATESRDLALLLGDGDGEAATPLSNPGESKLSSQLAALADSVERETADLRERYLTTAANLELYGDLLG
jgi:hypothetical protein